MFDLSTLHHVLNCQVFFTLILYQKHFASVNVLLKLFALSDSAMCQMHNKQMTSYSPQRT